MTRKQISYLLFLAGFCMITTLLLGDVLTLWENHGKMDLAFVTGMTIHYGAVVAAAAGGILNQKKSPTDTVSGATLSRLQADSRDIESV